MSKAKSKLRPKTKRMFEVSTKVELLSEAKINEALDRDSVERWAYIKHDKDVDEDGEAISAHWHIVFYIKHATTASAVAKWFDVEEQQVEFVKSKYFADTLIYLTHVLAEDKYEYSDEDVVSKKGYDWKTERNERLEYRRKNPNRAEVQKLIDKALRGEIRGYMVGNEELPADVYHKHMRAFDDAFLIFLRDIAPKNQKSRKVFFVSGESGAGKTFFAKYFAQNILKQHYYLSDNNNDPFQNYSGQPIVILDDFRGENMSVTDLLKVLEQTGHSTAKARYRNKGLSAVENIIITFPTPEELIGKAKKPQVLNQIIPLPEEMKAFYDEFKDSHQEPIRQFSRRVNFFVRTFYGGDSYIYVRVNNGEEWEFQRSLESQIDISQEDRKKDDEDFLNEMLGAHELGQDLGLLMNDLEIGNDDEQEVELFDEAGEVIVPF